MSILQDFPKNIIALQKNKNIIIDSIDGCPYLNIKFKIRNKEYIEEFKQISLNDNELWSCSCNSFLFSNKNYNIYKPSNNDIIELNNLSNILNGKNKVKILNFTNDMYDYDEWLDELVELI